MSKYYVCLFTILFNTVKFKNNYDVHNVYFFDYYSVGTLVRFGLR